MRHGTRNVMGWARRLGLVGATAIFAIIPFDCLGQTILRTVTPALLDSSNNALDSIIRAVAPLVLP